MALGSRLALPAVAALLHSAAAFGGEAEPLDGASLAAHETCQSSPETCPSQVVFQSCVLRGATRTRQETVCGMLPRAPPSAYSRDELNELERRLTNLQIFDKVAVTTKADVVTVDVREKWTLIPSVMLSTGSTLRDSYAQVGVTEYNTFGSANQTSASVAYEHRSISFDVSYSTNMYRPNQWTPAFDLFRVSANVAFENAEASTWYTTDLGGVLAIRPPYSFASPVRYEFNVVAYGESSEASGDSRAPADGFGVGAQVTATFDRYRYDDFVSSGFSCGGILRVGALLGPDQGRYGARLECLAASPIVALLGINLRVGGEACNTGNANWNVYTGSNLVRGLADGIYWTSGMAFFSVESRAGLRLGSRVGMQVALFSDGAIFRPMNDRGESRETQYALNVGAGLRFVPTFLSQLVARVDVGTLWYPQRAKFVQFGLSQYF